MDILIKSLILDCDFSLTVLETTGMVNDAIKIHNLTPLTAAALGRTLTACTFMSSGLKNTADRLYCTVAGDGVGGKITVCGNGELEMRGTIENPTANLPLRKDGKLDVGGCVGRNGRITVTKSMGLKEPYSGSSRLVSGEIAEDFASYFALSEQQPTAMALGVKIGKDLKCVGAGGVVLQALPFAREENIEKAEKMINDFKDISSMIEKIGAEGIMKEYFKTDDYFTYKPKYKCLCSREKMENLIISLGKNEAEDILKTEGKIKINCEFCNSEYIFTEEDVKKLFKS